jgi:hypothetical protein
VRWGERFEGRRAIVRWGERFEGRRAIVRWGERFEGRWPIVVGMGGREVYVGEESLGEEELEGEEVGAWGGEGGGVIVLIEWETGSIRNRRSESWPPFWSYFARTGFKQLPNSFVSERQKKDFWVNLNTLDTVTNFTETVL